VDDVRAAGAARYMAGRIMRIRLEAVRQSRAVALRFGPTSMARKAPTRTASGSAKRAF
jgi:hypothetical protein